MTRLGLWEVLNQGVNDAPPPPRLARVVLALMIASFAAFELFRIYQRFPDLETDFNLVWMGAKVLLEGGDPYTLTGPGTEYDFRWPPIYPATALVAAIPFSFLTEHVASIVFIWLSTFALAYGVTSRGWFLLPMFATEAFFSSVHLAQWSIVMTAALFIPWLGLLAVAKPHNGVAVIAASTRTTTLKAALIGGAVLMIISLAMRPSWPAGWMRNLATADWMIAPVTRFGGVFILLALLRWRRPEAWLLLSMACVPQNLAWYGTLAVLSVARNFREAAALALISNAGIMLGPYLVGAAASQEGLDRAVGGVLNATVYLPALILVLRRPNAGEHPAWLRLVAIRLAWVKPAIARRRGSRA